ncbi:hypothetical protein KUCAC02_009532 [Chaenocephalus aceratus]|nr:hypothetical protein KUCAC02_009532 [Chaenocephalus aceratus]
MFVMKCCVFLLTTPPRPCRKYQLFAIHTSKSCNILSRHTAFVPIDLDTNEYLHTCIEYSNAGEGSEEGLPVQLSLRQQEEPRVLRGGSDARSPEGFSEDAEDFLINNGEDGASPCSTPSSAGWERCSFTEVSQRSPSVASDHSQKSVESVFSARLALSRTRLLTRAAKGFMCRSLSKSGDSMGESDNENKDYIPLVLLQLASGAFPLDAAPVLRYQRSHGEAEVDLSVQQPSKQPGPPERPRADSVRGSVDTSSPRRLDPESLILGNGGGRSRWLEHSSASHFIEVRDGRRQPAVHHPETLGRDLQLNMLCYHPSSV